ncbi:xanthine dehydrogenase molybdenum binding subunit apoprotein [Desulfobotulus alkaliphilus]|uniref:Xanthine dehydrogenase molybdenum binding subunit apoprotein n=1 Tax=Desulfobotulus alkaliphilus TaxID=622671 RepID=A0A562R6T0_9BACT|nr:xanthine dehydrogenase family protein molybdopterin-binding subunit [Desulfobotulus alkaliphilus]TWI64792.1 xanthine dehydrogenase molybdenum binding subunit apoprotein [Desulfobotulus alkaliphilus]
MPTQISGNATESPSRSPMTIGLPLPRGDARAKACGREPYAADLFPENLLLAQALRSGLPCGRLLELDLEEARQIPGIVAILTAKDVPGSNRQGIIHKDMPVLVEDRIRYCGDPVALLIAENKEAIRSAMSCIRIHAEPSPGVFDLDEAMAENAPLVHEDKPGNMLAKATIQKGKPDFDACAAVVEGWFETPVQAHGFLETEAGTACLLEDGTLRMEVSTQSPFRDRLEISHALGIPFMQVHIHAPSLGGGFGGKDGATVQCLLGLAALHCPGRSVKMLWEREESFVAGYKRHACRMHYRLGALADGSLHSLHARLWYDTGAYAHLGPEVMELGMEHAAGPYRIPHNLTEGFCVHTHTPTGGAMRAFGVCQVSFAFESMMDMLAEKLKQDPLELRLRNALHRGDTNGAGVLLESSTSLAACLEGIRNHPLWQTRRQWQKEAPPFCIRGTGLAAVFNAAGYGGGVRDAAIAKIEMDVKGHFIVHNAVTDMGQGNSSAFLQIAGHILRQSAEALSLRQPDTRSAYPSGSSSAGRTTYTFGKALISACEELASRLINRAGLILFLQNDEGLVLEPGRVRHEPSGRSVSLEQLASFMSLEERVCLGQFIAPVCREVPDTSRGFFIGFPHVIFGYGAHLARVEVDTLTGRVQVKDYLALTDGGAVLNPSMFDQQVQGGVAQGIGYALYEDFITEKGVVKTKDFTTYLMPGSLDLPDILSLAPPVEEEESGPFGMKGIGEVAMNGPLPAIANALRDAGCRRIHKAPIMAEAVLGSLENR